ncbi:glycoside hydrolase family 2 protein [soil metagenome]
MSDNAPAPLLLDRWELLDFTPGEGAIVGAERGEGEGWIPVSAPGDVYLALIEAGRLRHPFEGRHEVDAAWVRDREWWWRTTFEADPARPGERVELVFEGLDTFAAIHLDGLLIGRTDNMFRRYVFDIGDRLTGAGPHVLSIRFDPPGLVVQPADLPVWSAFTDRVSRSHRNLVRKAQFGWGWDWGPDLPTVGVWKPVRIERRRGAVLRHLSFATLSVGDTLAETQVRIDVDPCHSVDLRLEVELRDPDGRVVVTRSGTPTPAVDLRLAVPDPQLWWTADLGSQPLYDLTVRLFSGEALLDTRRQTVGLRTIALDTSPDPDAPGDSLFRFVLNGVPIFAKGACWVPTTSFVADVDEARYRRLIEQAARANMNMIRVWGGGIYEPDLFHDLCDELGLLVWQDFMFACAHYPEDCATFENVRGEVADQVRRLRNHPSLALWCGNNESQAMHAINAALSGDTAALSGAVYYDDLIPGLLADRDPTTPYWPGSPSGGPNPNSMRAGDVHDWTVWHGVPPIPDTDLVGGFDSSPEGVAYARYAEDTASFVSEFGIQAAPAMATLERWMDPADLVLGSEGFLERVKDEAHKADALMIPVTGLPTTLQDYVDFTQWTQAEGLKFGIEHFRRRTPHCSGALIWQFNDCWPCVSWSLIDWDGVEKASYHAVRRAFAPVLASFKCQKGDQVEIWITNDTLASISGEAVVTLSRLDGHAVWSETVAFAVPATASLAVGRGQVAAADDLVLTVLSPDDAFAPNRHLPAPISRLALSTRARPAVTIARIEALECRVTLAADDYLAFVHLTSARADLRFSDNYFDLAAGDRRTVVVTAPTPFAEDAFDIRCWNARS